MQNAKKARFGGALRSVKDRFAHVARVIKKILLAVKLLTLSVYSIYLIYEIVTGAFVVFKSILLGLTVAYAIFYIIKHDKIDKPSRAAKKISRRLYASSKILINGCTLALTVFGLFAARVAPTLWSVMLAFFMLVGWCLSLIFELLYLFAERQAEKIASSVKAEAKSVSDKIAGARARRAARRKPRTGLNKADVASLTEQEGDTAAVPVKTEVGEAGAGA